MVGVMKAAVFLFYTYALIIGSVFVEKRVINSVTDEPYKGGEILSVIIALITGFMTLIASLPNI